MDTIPVKKVKFPLRLDEPLMDAVRKAAGEKRRSVNSQLCFIVENWLKKARPEAEQG